MQWLLSLLAFGVSYIAMYGTPDMSRVQSVLKNKTIVQKSSPVLNKKSENDIKQFPVYNYGKIRDKNQSNDAQVKEYEAIPQEWMVLQPKKVPFVPFQKVDYKKMYEQPVDVSQYAGAGRVYNKNYKPYHPEAYLYVTNYSYKNFLKISKVYKNKKTYDDSEIFQKDLKMEYNKWLWNKIRSDFKRVHGMYNATIIDYRGVKHNITWEDGGLVSIYEQRKLFYQYAKIDDSIRAQHWKFMQNFRYAYKDVRVNNPYIIFSQPDCENYRHNKLYVDITVEEMRDKLYKRAYLDKYQTQIPKDGVLTESFDNTDLLDKNYEYSNYIGPDGYYDANLSTRPYWEGVVLNDITDAIVKKQEHEFDKKRDNIYLYYEIFDEFCSKYGGKYTAKQKMKEVDLVYKTKKDKVKAKPYSVEKIVKRYKKLTKDDVETICRNLMERLNVSEKYINDSTCETKTIMTDYDIEKILYIYGNQPEKFREYAHVLDEKYSRYYPR